MRLMHMAKELTKLILKKEKGKNLRLTVDTEVQKLANDLLLDKLDR